MDRLKSMRRFTVALVLVVILGLGAGVGLGYMNTERLISDGLILGSIGALRYSVEVLSQARDQAISRESQAEVEASQALVFLAASQDAADQGQDPTPYLQRARTHLQAAIGLDIDNAFLYSLLGDVEFAVGNVGSATVAYERALEHEPDAVDALFGLGRIDVQAGRTEEALETLHKAQELAPDHLGIALLLAEQLAATSRYEEAVEILTKVELFDPRVPQVHFQLATYYHALGQFDEALHRIERTLDLDPEFGPAHKLRERIQTP
ncbi:MAG: tetratricopeptide repeat protein [Firmicutes bacterium]|nr:tetratricopeptide repeat protein [Bacillota bacterium]